MSVAVVALALLESVQAFQAPASLSRTVAQKAASPQMFSEGDIGVLPPLGVFDPLGLISTRNMYRYECMEIKHGRAAMLGFVHVILLVPPDERGHREVCEVGSARGRWSLCVFTRLNGLIRHGSVPQRTERSLSL